MRHSLLALIVSSCLSNAAGAEELKPIEIALRPRAIENPILKYRLLPAEWEMKPGDAAPILLRLPWEQMPWMNNVYPTLESWENRPLKDPEWAKFAGVVPDRFYEEMKRAAFRRDASWEYPIFETTTPYMIHLPDVQGLRGFLGLGLSARIRYRLSRGELDEAREGILVGLANGRHLARTPFYVNQLVALAIDRKMLDRTVELIAQPDSPNLYWALSTLPDSLAALDSAASLEADIFEKTFPAVRDLDRPRDDREWSKMAAQLVRFLQELGELPADLPPQAPSGLGDLLRRLLPEENPHVARFAEAARRELPQLLGLTEDAVAEMSDEEAAVRWYATRRLARDHQMSAALVLPAREAWPRLKTLRAEIRSLEEQTGAPQPDFFDPVTIYVSFGSVGRRIAALRIVEAVRHHLSVRGGELPRSLEEIGDLPIPLDPLTDEPFQWSVEGKTATLKAPALPAGLVERDSASAQSAFLEYRLTVE
jgi:hypothetical protein